MSYEIRQVDFTNKEVEYELRLLIKEAFGMEELIPEGFLYLNTVSKSSSKPTIFLAAIEDGKIIGCNGFISTDFELNGETIACYQSCWTATHPKHQGRKIFVNIINEAKRILKDIGGGFIYGVPNNNSRPIFIKKLGFKEIPCLTLKIPNILIVRNFWLNKALLSANHYNNDSIKAVEKQMAELKKNQDDSVVELLENDSYLWGKIQTKEKYGFKIKYFYIGGLSITNPKDFYLLMGKAFSLPVQYIQIVSCQTNRYNQLFRNWKQSSGINPFIFFELNTENLKDVNIMYGAIDVF